MRSTLGSCRTLGGSVPLGTMGQKLDVAKAISFLLSEDARWISGAELSVDGGMLASPMW